MERYAFALRIAAVIAGLALLGFAVATALTAWITELSAESLSLAAFYAGMLMLGIALFLVMPLGHAGMGTASLQGGGDFARQLGTFIMPEVKWDAERKQAAEHRRRATPVAFCVALAGLILFVAGTAGAWLSA